MGVRSAAFRYLSKHSLVIWVAGFARMCWDQAHAGGAGSRDYLSAAGAYAGALDAAEGLGIGSWSLARRMLPDPPAAPTEDRDVLQYLGGYLAGHAMIHLAKERASRRQEFWARALNGPVAAYTAGLATPNAQRMLAMPGERAVRQAHQFACIMAAKIGRSVTDLELEIALFSWLCTRSGVEIPPEVNHLVARLRLRREQRRDSPAS